MITKTVLVLVALTFSANAKFMSLDASTNAAETCDTSPSQFIETLMSPHFLLQKNVQDIDASTDATEAYTVSQDEIFIKILMLKKYLGAKNAGVLSEYMKESIENNKLPINVVLAIAYIESGFKQGAMGTKRDTGIMQVMPFWKKNKLCSRLRLWHAKDNIECGCRILKYYVDMFDGDIVAGVTSYNRGSHATKKFVRKKVNMRKRVWYPKVVFNVVDLLDSFDKHRGERD
jgi:soluble lytic murein transglycosylase-like protein